MAHNPEIVNLGGMRVVKPGSTAERVRSLQAEAKSLAAEHIAQLVAAMQVAEAISVEIAAGGDAYPAGVRDIARRQVEEMATRSQTIESIMGRR